MNNQAKSKEELINELLEFRQAHTSLKAILEADLHDTEITGQALKTSEERFQLLFDKAPLGYQSLDFDGNFVEVNQQWLDTLGYKREEVIGQWFGNFLSGDFKDGFRKRFPIFKERGKIHSEFEMVHKNGKILLIGFDGRIGYDTEGNFKQTHCILQDITEVRAAERELVRSREMLKNMGKAAKIGGWEFDVETLSQTWTEEIFHILEIDTTHGTPHVPKGIGFIAPEFQSMALLGIQRAIEFGEPYNQEWEVITAKGNKRWINAIATPSQENGKTKSVAGSFQNITERKQAELALVESEERYRNLLGNLEAGIVVHAPDTSIVMNNHKASELLGLSNDQMKGKAAIDPAWKLINEDNTPLSIDLYPVNRIVSSRQPIKNQVLGRQHPGKNEFVWVTVNGFPVLNSSGEIVEIVISFIDITERKKSELLLQEKAEEIAAQNEEYLQLNEDLNQTNQELAKAKERAEKSEMQALDILQTAIDGFWTVDSGGRLIDMNQVACEMLGYSREEMLTLSVSDIDIEETAEQIQQHIQKVRENGKDRFDTKHRCKDGRIIAVEVSVTFQPSNNLMFVFVSDISGRKHLEKIREIQYDIATAVITSDSIEQLFEFVRTQLSQLFDTTNFFAALYNAKNNTLKKLHWIDQVDEFDEWGAAKSFSGYVVKTGKTLLLDKQEIAKLAAEQSIPIIGTLAECWLGVPLVVDKKTIGVVVIQSYTDSKAYDTSIAMLFEQVAYNLSVFIEKTRILQDLKIAKNRAEESDQLKSAFLANMSHEIRTPMNGILGFAELLKTPDLSGEEQQKYIKIIEKGGARMLNIINDIISISKIEAGLMKADLKVSNINEQIEFIYNFFKPEVEAKGMTISYKNPLPAKEAIIKTDREKLYAILTNLIKNSIKYTNQGFIEFGYDLVETDNYPSLRFFVKDTGIGIPQDRQDAIFKRFIQADITNKMALQGAGLGLSITKAYVEILNGKIWVESQQDVGSIFYFTLPYNAERV